MPANSLDPRQRRGAISPYRSAASLLRQAAGRGGRRAGGLPVCALFLAVGAGELGSYRAARFRSMRALEVRFDDTLSSYMSAGRSNAWRATVRRNLC